MNTKGGLTKKTAQVQQIQQKDTSLKGLIKAMGPQIKKALPSVLTPERFTRMVFTALSTNPQLQQCTPASFLGAMMQAAQLGVEPNTPIGQAYLIPYRNKGKLECQFQIGYKGLIDLAYRAGTLRTSRHTKYMKTTYSNTNTAWNRNSGMCRPSRTGATSSCTMPYSI